MRLFRHHKFIILMIIIVVIAFIIFVSLFLAFFVCSNDFYESSLNRQFYDILKDDKKIKKLSNNTYNYLVQNKRKKIEKESDNQGSDNIYYYVFQFGKRTIGINGIDHLTHVKITSIFLN